jgi:hypothetical protein
MDAQTVLGGAGYIRMEEYRPSDWPDADPPEGDKTRCGNCGQPEHDHPRPWLVVRDPEAAARFLLRQQAAT